MTSAQAGKPGILKRIIRFLFVGIWESAYRNKKRRGLFRYHTLHESHRETHRAYYPRYRWLTRKKDK